MQLENCIRWVSLQFKRETCGRLLVSLRSIPKRPNSHDWAFLLQRAGATIPGMMGGLPTQKVRRVLAVLGLVWAIDIVCGHIFPSTWMNLHVFVLNVFWHVQQLGNKAFSGNLSTAARRTGTSTSGCGVVGRLVF